MLLSALLAATEQSVSTPPATGGDPDIGRVVHDSRIVTTGDLFCCITGHNSDGHAYAPEAVEAGAVAVLAERTLDIAVPVLVVPSVRRMMPLFASQISGVPSQQLDVIGVTGTNGKTSVVHLLAAILEHAGRWPATIGTLTGSLTTPEAPDLQAQLASWAGEGRSEVIMEVSSHALDQHRVDGTRFSAVAFTNLSRDHLDHHHTMESYAAAKERLFSPSFTDQAVVLVDSEAGRRVADRALEAGLTVVEVSVANIDRTVQLNQVAFSWRGLDVQVPVGGDFTVANSVLAAELALLAGVEPTVIVDGLAGVAPIPGRFEPVEVEGGAIVIVDYAHSPDSLTQLLASARGVSGGGRVISVFGCGGERDAGKRPEMGRAAHEGADLVVVTSDNPRGDPPEGVIADILTGMAEPPAHAIVDRRQAIRMALALARSGDVVVVSGKGHETAQMFGGDSRPFDDRIVVREEAAALAHNRGSSAGNDS